MKKIIIFESETDSLRTFAHLMAEGFQERGCQVLMADMRQEIQAREEIYAFTEPGKTSVLFFNHAGLNLLTENKASIWNELNVDCYDFIVDHPMYYHAAIKFPVQRLTFLCVDEYHQKFIQRFYQGRVRSFFLPLAGIRSSEPEIPFEKRSMDILFTGAYLVDENVEYHIQGLGEGLRQIWLECFDLLCSRTSLTLEQGMEFCLKKKRTCAAGGGSQRHGASVSGYGWNAQKPRPCAGNPYPGGSGCESSYLWRRLAVSGL